MYVYTYVHTLEDYTTEWYYCTIVFPSTHPLPSETENVIKFVKFLERDLVILCRVQGLEGTEHSHFGCTVEGIWSGWYRAGFERDGTGIGCGRWWIVWEWSSGNCAVSRTHCQCGSREGHFFQKHEMLPTPTTPCRKGSQTSLQYLQV